MTEQDEEAVTRRVHMTMRLAPHLRTRIESAAAENGRSLTQEVEHRLERSFWEDGLRTLVVEAVREAKG